MREIPIWSASASPKDLPANEWTLMVPSNQGMTPDGWEEQEPPSIEDCVTDLTTRRGLGLAMQKIKARKAEKAARAAAPEPSLSGAPLGLVKHLQSIIDEQRREIESLKSEVARLKRKTRG